MKTLYTLLLLLSINCLAQETKVDTIVFNYSKYGHVRGPGAGKVQDTSAYAEYRTYIYYYDQSVKMNSHYNWIQEVDQRGIIRREGLYYKQYANGPMKVYDKMGRISAEGNWKFYSDTTYKIKRKEYFRFRNSQQIGVWKYYEYENSKDTVGTVRTQLHEPN